MNGLRSAFNRAWPAIVLALAIGIGWSVGVSRNHPGDFAAPLMYASDSLGVLAQIKAYSSGEIIPLLPKEVGSLGAPFAANWTDYPSEDLVYFTAGLFSRAFGLFAGSTVFVLLLQILAGLAFFTVGNALGYRRSATFAAALLFALAPYAFVRGLEHLSLTCYWHVPLALFSIGWASEVAGREAGEYRSRALAILGAALAGLLNPYYLAVFLWLGFIGLVGALTAGRWRSARRGAVILTVAASMFLLQSLDSLWMLYAYGPNAEGVTRDLRALDVYGLKLPDLAFPYVHRWAAFQSWADATYQLNAPGGRGRGEAMTAYIGLVACCSLIALVVVGTIRIAARQFERVSSWYWMCLATIGLGIAGGINYFFGAFGFVMLRGTNRFSIVLMAIALFWLCEVISRRTWSRPALAVLAASLAVVVGLWDQIPPAGAVPAPDAVRSSVDSDARFVRALEQGLPEGAMVLQLPIKRFPETGPMYQMGDYEHFRPYLHSRGLRFSYGTVKGRSDGEWQTELVSMTVPALASRAAELGFKAIYVNRKGYSDHAKDLEARLRELLGTPIADIGDLVAFRAPPSPDAPLLPLLQDYKGFSTAESDGGHFWRWATQQRATIRLAQAYSGMEQAPPVRTPHKLEFVLQAANDGKVEIYVNARRADVYEGGGERRVSLELPGPENQWLVELRSDRPPRVAGNGDSRLISFRVLDLSAR